MSLDDLLRYLMWIVFFGLALTGLYFMFKRIGVL